MTTIIEPNEPNDNQNNVSVALDVPLRFHLVGKRSDAEYRRCSLEHLRDVASDIAELIAYLGGLGMYTSNVPEPGIFGILGEFNRALMEAMEGVDLDFERGNVRFFPERVKTEPVAVKAVVNGEAVKPDVDLSCFRMARELFEAMSDERKTAFLEHGWQLPELILAVLNHSDLPNRLFNTIHNAIELMSDSEVLIPVKADDIEQALNDERCRPLDGLPRLLTRTAELETADDAARLGRDLSAVLNNPLTPVGLYNAIVDELGDLTGPVIEEFIKSPAAIEDAFRRSAPKNEPVSLSGRKSKAIKKAA